MRRRLLQIEKQKSRVNEMKRIKRYWLKNQMLIGNALANVLGVTVVRTIGQHSIAVTPPEVYAHLIFVDWLFMPLSFLSVWVATVIWERPIRRCLDRIHQGGCGPKELEQKARRRLLNEPFFLIACDFIIWMIAGVVYSAAAAQIHSGNLLIGRIFFQAIYIGIITTTAAFFILERMLQRNLAPVFFPQGGLYQVPKTLRIRIRTRLTALITAVNLIPFIAFLTIIRGTYRLEVKPEEAFELLRGAVLANSVLFVAVGIGLTILVNSYLTRPFDEIIRVLRGVVHGRLDRKVSVSTNDEIGYVGDVINEMTEGLKERERLRHSLELAREVQQSLLPKKALMPAGLDVAGRSIYCDQTGGDYFDYLALGRDGQSRLALLVGDVSGHGIPSALLMATARALLRQRSILPGGIAEVITDVNRELAKDVGDSGRFMTLFYLLIDSSDDCLKWVRAGHDPAIFYDPRSDTFEELGGPGMALGVDATWQYQDSKRKSLAPGQIVVVGTDGIWESRDGQGAMFGKQAFMDVVRRYASATAEDILEAVIDSVKRFQKGFQPEDDLTLVVVKA